MRDQAARLADILEAIAAIRRHAERGRAVFDADELVQVWIVHHLEIIGEAATKLDARGIGGLRLSGERPHSVARGRSSSISRAISARLPDAYQLPLRR